MWLLETSTFQLRQFYGRDVPPYAILSHTWGPDEVTFDDMQSVDLSFVRIKAGFQKIQRCCDQALIHGYEYAWVDSCCIDKKSSAELTEAINSMFKFYGNSSLCYAYLDDVPDWDITRPFPDEQFAQSRWFTRGWTLQELVAPQNILFYSEHWSLLEHAISAFHEKLSSITWIPMRVLEYPQYIFSESVARRMVLASNRETTREEDIAYCLMGLFNVNMPILYGEGRKNAFKRLQYEIIRSSPDHTIFTWRNSEPNSGLIAADPKDFSECHGMASIEAYDSAAYTISLGYGLVRCAA
ncbi:heterokaryon incompatibility protein-domain-containing protein [Stachybotrys elegans]|uniref:Heterokaryon incompatibility protein-domain-containing protein n=1 Tax=Stachybotrys elegans TaxID=80388 RepID=A0A8K0SQ31_9HYPO|nr:heterokaryon incompatibility protein-domain-containing protein [Stachybotrys elegans]